MQYTNTLEMFAVSGSGWNAFLLLNVVIFGLFFVIFILFSPIIIMSSLAKRKAEQYKNEHAQTIIAQYDAPLKLSPAEIGCLYDLDCGKKELKATLLDLQARRLIYKYNDSYELTPAGLKSQLSDYESIAINLTPYIAENQSTLQQIDAKQFTVSLPTSRQVEFNTAVKSSLHSKGLPLKSYRWQFFIRVVLTAILLSLLPMATVAMPAEFNGQTYDAFSVQSFISSAMLTLLFGFILFPVYWVTSFLLVYVITKTTGNYWLATKQIRKIWPEIEGYRRYIKTVELDNIQFEAAQRDNKAISRVAAYAMALNLKTNI